MKRVLYVPNEAGEARQVGARRALNDLRANELVGDVEVFSLLHMVRGGLPAARAFNDLEAAVENFKPDIVLMQHMGGAGFNRADLRKLRSKRAFTLVYYEGDAYAWPFRPLPKEARAAAAASDITFVSGLGAIRRAVAKAGARDVRLLESHFEPDRLETPEWPAAVGRTFDVVVIANRLTPRLRGLPGWRDRIRFVELLQHELGDRCAVYGRGWTGASARGPLPYGEQQAAIRSAWVSANWDHFPTEPFYHSDRLPIALAAGTVHATTWHPGFDELFPEDVRRSMILRRSPEELVAAIAEFLHNSDEQSRLAMMKRAQVHAWGHLRCDDQLVVMLNAAGAEIDPDRASAGWSVAGTSFNE